MSYYVLPKLPFAFDGLEPYMDARTVQVHYLGHHKAYVDKLNKAMDAHPRYRHRVEALLASLDSLPPEIRTPVEQNGGGHQNHCLFWSLLTPQPGEPPAAVEKLLSDTFGRLEDFRAKFTEVAAKHFSNGWAWLAADRTGKLEISSTKDHESPVSRGMTPLLVLDVWEHAYYLKHQNKRPDYIEAFWNIVNWDEVGKRWEEFERTGSTNREWRLAG